MYQAKNTHLPNFLVARYKYMNQLQTMEEEICWRFLGLSFNFSIPFLLAWNIVMVIIAATILQP